jgi:hypothetical protein
MVNNTISIEYTKEQIRNMSDSEKLNFIVETIMTDHQEISDHSDILYGKDINGKFEPGLCEITRLQGWKIIGLFTTGSAGLGMTATALIMHLMKS